MAGKWVTFDCYGTLVDWLAGQRAAIAQVAPDDVERLLTTYHHHEPQVQAEQPGLRYRHVLTEALRRAAADEDVALGEPGADILARTLPDWPVYDDVGPALTDLRDAGWKLAILSNVDDDLLAGTQRRLPVTFDHVITAQQVGSYKPHPGHFHRFRTEIDPESWVHVAQSVFHDHVVAGRLALPRVWINRQEEPDPGDVAEIVLPDLAGLTTAVTALANLSAG